MISTVVVTYNEAGLLKDCLASVAGESDEVVIVDLGSEDNSLKIAKDFGAKVFTHRRVEYVEKVRDFAVSCAVGDWILVLDPDERVGPSLWKRLKDVIKEDKHVAVNIPRKNIFFGKWIAHTNWWPDKHIRFFKKNKVQWVDKIHTYPKISGKILDLPIKQDLAIVHYGYESISQFIDRQNRYSEIEAHQRDENGEKFSWGKFFWWPTREFLVRFMKHQGYLDGFYGFALTFLMMIYQMEVMIKLWELEKQK